MNERGYTIHYCTVCHASNRMPVKEVFQESWDCALCGKRHYRTCPKSAGQTPPPEKSLSLSGDNDKANG